MKSEIGKNVSSGAKKVERVEEETFTQESVDTKKPAAPVKKSMKNGGAMSKGSAKKEVSKTAEQREEAAADKRIAEARKRAEKKKVQEEKKVSAKQSKTEQKAALKDKKLAHKRAVAEKRLARKEMIARKRAELKEKKVERRAEKAARREMLKNESKAERQNRLAREKSERMALRSQKQAAREKARESWLQAKEAARVRKAEDKKHKREQKTERRTAGFGGWLAAVISLGTACLILATIVTAGSFRMNEMMLASENGYRSTLYEMAAVSEDLDENLGKLRISSGANEQRRLLTDILVDSALMESALEKVPVDSATGTDISSFVNSTGIYARTMLAKLASGRSLSAQEIEHVSRLYEINDRLYNELNGLIMNMTESDLREFLEGNAEGMSEKFGEMGRRTRLATEELAHAPFAGEGNVGENRLARFAEISVSEAEARAMKYFENYHVREIKYTGETIAREVSCYNFVLTDENDLEIFAEITKNGGKLAFFDTYEECTQKNFDLETCDAIAREFLKGIGIENVGAVWMADGGMVANLTYTTVSCGVRIYPEIIRVRVCEEKGRVVGMDARGYLLNEKERMLEHALTKQEAAEKLSAGLEVHGANLALIPVEGREAIAYEFSCGYGEDEYIVYIDANSGEELRIYRVRESARGSYLR